MYEPISLVRDISFEEQVLLQGKAGRDLHEIAQEVAQGHANPNHVKALTDIAEKFSQVTGGIVASLQNEWLTTEGGVLLPESQADQTIINFSPIKDNDGGERRWKFSRMSTSTSRDVVSLTVRPLPLIWNAEHIKERHDLRAHYNFNPGEHFLRTLPLGIAMTRILEKMIDWKRVKYAPFVLPTSDGLFLGTAQLKGNRNTDNRFAVLGFNQAGAYQIGRYEWQPSIELTARTFIGLRDMRPAQQKLKNMLVKFLSPENTKALSLELCAYGYVDKISDANYEIDQRRERYEKLFVELEDVMKSLVWKKGTSLPAEKRFENRRFP